MAFGGSIGKAIGTSAAGTLNSAKGLGGTVFGNSQDAGILGTGQFKGEGQAIDEKAFKEQERLRKRQEAFQAQLAATNARQAQQVQAAQIATGPQDQFRAAQMGLLSQLQNQAAGQGPSLAQMQLKSANDRNLAQAMAMAATRGGGGGLALRGLQQQRADLGAQAGQQSAMLRLQEQQQAQGALAGLAGGARGQDIGLATQQAQLGQQAALANQDAALRQMSLNDAQSRFLNEGMGNMDLAQQKALMDLEQLKVNQNLGIQGINAGSYDKAAERRGGLIGGIGSGIASIAASDKKLKTKIKPGEEQLDKFLSGLRMAEGGLITSEDKPEEDSTEAAAKKILSDQKAEQGMTGHQKLGSAIGKGIAGGYKKYKDGQNEEKLKAGVDSPSKMDPDTAYAYKGGYASGGGKVEGKAEVMGDSPRNDKVPAMLSPGEIVVPRTVAKPALEGDHEKLQQFVDGLKSHSYQYKDKKHGEGSYNSPMAQELEKSELGKSMVIDTPEGKMVDYARAGGTMLATAAMLNEKMKKIEEKIGMSEGGVVESMKTAFKTPEAKMPDDQATNKKPSEWFSGEGHDKKKASGISGAFKNYADGGVVGDDRLANSMRLAFNFIKKDPPHEPDYSSRKVTDEEKRFTDAMKKAFRGK